MKTGCPPLDELLEGGLEADAVTLVFGEGGSGKTNLALQCARIAAASGKRVAYVDSEGVSATRLRQIFAMSPGAEDRLLFFTPYDFQEQETMVQRASLIRNLGLIVVDSINMHYRLLMDDEQNQRKATQSLVKQLHHLTGVARKHRVPVLITGQVYGGEDSTQPFARRTMEHLVKALVRFEKRPDSTRRATILKHRSIREGLQCQFQIGAHGLEAVGEPMEPPEMPVAEPTIIVAGELEGSEAVSDGGGPEDEGADPHATRNDGNESGADGQELDAESIASGSESAPHGTEEE